MEELGMRYGTHHRARTQRRQSTSGAAAIPSSRTARAAGEKSTPTSTGGTQVGKRYTDEDSGLVVLVTKAGEGALAIGDAPLELVQPKLLPSSD